jgi:hypothetical protein
MIMNDEYIKSSKEALVACFGVILRHSSEISLLYDTGFCELGYEPSDSIRGGKFLDYPTDC